MITAEQLITRTAKPVRTVFDATGIFRPMVHFMRDDGSEAFFTFPAVLTDKDQWAIYARAVLKAEKAVTCVFVNEAWALYAKNVSREDVDRLVEKGLEHNPDRQEIIMFGGEDVNGAVTAAIPIIRPEGRKACLGDLKIDERMHSEGRFVGLLPAKKANA